jgi:hypothetical protein
MVARKNKKAISELLSYVLLVTIALAMAAGVYAYLRFYAQNPLPEEQCDGISVAIMDYSCTSNVASVTIKNTGRFETYVQVKLYDSQNRLIGNSTIYSGQLIKKIKINEEETVTLEYTGALDRIEVTPFITARDNTNQLYTKFCPESRVNQEAQDCESRTIQSTL